MRKAATNVPPAPELLRLRERGTGLRGSELVRAGAHAGLSAAASQGADAEHVASVPSVLDLRGAGSLQTPTSDQGANAVCCGVNPVGELDAGKLHVQFDERGTANGVTDRTEAPAQAKAAGNSYSPILQPPRRSPTLLWNTATNVPPTPHSWSSFVSHHLPARPNELTSKNVAGNFTR